MASFLSNSHSSLVLGNLVDSRVLKLIQQINQAQDKIDSAQAKMQSTVAMKRSLDMTVQELLAMNIDTSALTTQSKQIESSIAEAAGNYVTVRLQNEQAILKLREQISDLELEETPESPLDFTQSNFRNLPLAGQSLQLDAQYFSFESNQQDDMVATIEKYIRDSTSNLGTKSNEIAKTAANQVNQQRQQHNLSGTLVITSSCVHPNVRLIDPVVMDEEKALDNWNRSYPEAALDAEDVPGLQKAAREKAQADGKHLTLLTGATYGSSFVGMVHIVRTEATQQGDVNALAEKLQQQLTLGAWLQERSGGIGVDPAVKREVMQLLSVQQVLSHVSLVVTGAVPSIASSELAQGVKQLAGPQAEQAAKSMQRLQQLNSSLLESVDSEADAALNGSKLMALQGQSQSHLVSALAETDQSKNKVLDVNTLMSAFENYIAAIQKPDESVGVPLSFYTRQLTRAQLAASLLKKYRKQASPTPGSANATSE